MLNIQFSCIYVFSYSVGSETCDRMSVLTGSTQILNKVNKCPADMRTLPKMFVDLGVSGKIDIQELKDYTALRHFS